MIAKAKADPLNGFPTDIGNILVRMGAISWEELHSAVERQKEEPGKKLGELLIESDLITPDILGEALKLQTDLRPTDGNVPVASLVRLFNRAAAVYRQTNIRLGHKLDNMALVGGGKR